MSVRRPLVGFLAAMALLLLPDAALPARTDTDRSLDFQIGQMLMVGYRGMLPGPDHPMMRAIHEQHIGGVILFNRDLARGTDWRNIRSPEQVRALTARLQAA
ncbi:MAG TPA: glycoside hydrolase family 3, partial [Gammaproteobacteria bacterium]|nr:glycoside hydrolase family 3 [Gammaproteobacteria bacterium]